MVKQLGGTPIVLGIYPKSRSVINILDYTLLINKIYKCNELNLDDKDMFKNIYIESFKEGD